jgi:methyltransferase OMS1
MAANVAKKLLLVTAGGGTYEAAVILSYQLMATSKKGTSNDNNINELKKSEHVCESSLVSSAGNFCKKMQKEETYRRVATIYDDTIGRDELFMGTLLLRRALLHFHARGTVLEVAAGTGRNLQYYPTSAVTKVVIVDSSESMLQKARQKIQQQQQKQQKERQNAIQFETNVADASNLAQYEDNTFDTVVDTFGLCSFDDPAVVLKELQRVCKPEGKILLLEHGRTKSYSGLSNYLDKHAEQHARNWNCVWNRDIEQIVRDSGLKIQSYHTWHFGTTYYMVCLPQKKQQ